MKKAISLILALVLCIGLCACVGNKGTDAETTQDTTLGTEETGPSYTEELTFEPGADMKSYVVTGLGEIPNSTDIVIPDMYNNAPVTAIADKAFEGNTGLTSIAIPTSVTQIGDDAFTGCAGLIGIWVNEDNLNYSSDSFGVLFNKDKTSLIRVPGGLTGEYSIPESVTTIKTGAFEKCISLLAIEIPYGVTTIEAKAFADCDSITEIIIPDSVIDIAGDLHGMPGPFWKCDNLKSITLSAGLTFVEGSLICYCENLEKLVIPSKDTEIQSHCIYECGDNLTVYGVPGSYAEDLAKHYNWEFVAQ